jgi:hypothetical protein
MIELGQFEATCFDLARPSRYWNHNVVSHTEMELCDPLGFTHLSDLRCLMKKFLLVLGTLGLATLATTAYAAPRRCATTYAPVATAPVAVPATAQAETGYRAFSYQPTAPAVVGTARLAPRGAQPGWMNAATKAKGRY